MSRLLYIKSSPMGSLSYSIAAADAFVDSYRKVHPDDEIEIIDLFEDRLPKFDFAAASAKYKIMHGKEHSQKDRRIWAEIVSVIERFKSADKYVFAVPMWNFSIPYRLKQYIDIIVQPGCTFTVTEQGGYEGLVKNRLAFIAYARGGQYPQGTEKQAFDMQKSYLELILAFMGFSNICSVIVEPTLEAGPDIAKQKLAEAVEKAAQMARRF